MQNQPRKIALLEVEESERWAGYIEPLWKEAIGRPGDEWSTFKCFADEFPSPEQVGEFDAIVIGGSHHSCLDADPWIVKLRDELIPMYAARAPRLIGCCFGSQIVAAALGGKVGSNPSGRFVLDRETLHVKDTLKQYPQLWQALASQPHVEDGALRLWEAHGEQVLELPPGAELLASSDNTQHELWHVGPNVLGFQFHPEFNGQLMYDKIWSRLTPIGRLSPEEAVHSKDELLNGKTDSLAARSMIRAFIENGFDTK